MKNRPLVLVLDLSSKCHIRCQKCFVYHSNMQNHTGHMSLETFEIIRPLLSTALLVVGHENGESMLNRHFPYFLAAIKDAGCRFTFNTTGHLFNGRNVQLIVEKQVDEIMFSIDSLNDETYAYLHKGAQLNSVKRNIDRLQQYKKDCGSPLPLLGLYHVASKSNAHETFDVITFAAEKGFNSIYLGHLNSPSDEQYASYSEFYQEETLIGTESESVAFAKKVCEASDLAKRLGLKFYTSSL